MTADQATQDIIHLVYEAAVISPDPFVQETHVETSIRDLLEELLIEKTGVEEDLESEIRDLEGRLENSRYRVGELEVDNEVLKARLAAFQELAAA